MRNTRVRKFKKYRQRKARNYIFFAVVFPCLSIFVGYLITSLVILPTIKR